MSRRPFARIVLVAVMAALSGCGADWVREHPLGCRADEQALVRDTLYFGRAIPGGGDVDAAAWERFETDVLTPAFAQGYTVLEGRGLWRDAEGRAQSEATRVVVIVHADDAAAAAALRDVVARYRTMFKQESVLRERGNVCASF